MAASTLGALSPLPTIGAMSIPGHAQADDVPPVGWNALNTKIGDNQTMRRSSRMPDSGLPRLRRAWDRLPSAVRRPIVLLMRNDWLRLTLLDRLGIRSRSGFVSVSDGGPPSITLSLESIAKSDLHGDYYEFGLYRGYTLWLAQREADRLGLDDMKFFGFDSFSGLPDVRGADRDAAIFIPGDYGASKAEVTRYLTEHGFDWRRGHLVEGFFDASLTEELKTKLEMRPAALVMVDCDLYQSTVPVLKFIENLLQDGTILIFDDWHCFSEDPTQGEPRAFAEFLSRRPDIQAEHVSDYPTYGRIFRIKLDKRRGG